MADEAIPDEAILDPAQVVTTIADVHLTSSSYVGTTRVELPLEDDDYTAERRRAVTKLTPEGVKPLTDAELEAEQRMTKQLLKKAAANILQLDISRMSFPVAYSEPRSFLERLSDLFSSVVTTFLPRVIKESDANNRLQLFAIGLLSSFNLDMTSKKPWNPILGETYVCQWANRASFYAEQISHHPPISAAQLVGPDGAWTCSGRCSGRVENSVQGIGLEQRGKFSLTLEDGTEFEWEFPTIFITGNVSGTRLIRVKGPFSVFDRTNDLECIVEISPKTDKKRKDTVRATTVYGWVKGERTGTVSGDYCGKLILNGNVVWDIEQPSAVRPTAPVPDEDLLRSDCRYRLDRNLFIGGMFDEADAAKTALEKLQRRDEALRSGLAARPREKPPPPPPAQKGGKSGGSAVKSAFSGFKKFAGKKFAKIGKKDSSREDIAEDG
jgi:hypothetical protein